MLDYILDTCHFIKTQQSFYNYNVQTVYTGDIWKMHENKMTEVWPEVPRITICVPRVHEFILEEFVKANEHIHKQSCFQILYSIIIQMNRQWSSSIYHRHCDYAVFWRERVSIYDGTRYLVYFGETIAPSLYFFSETTAIKTCTARSDTLCNQFDNNYFIHSGCLVIEIS